MIEFSIPFQDFNYSQFLQEFLPQDLMLQREDLVKQSYQKYITNGHILGTVKSFNLSILEFRQTSEYDPRVSLAKEAFRIMADHRIRRGLVIFWNPQTRNWRLSLMTISLDIDEKNNIVRNYSNAKRFSFLLGEGEAMKTPRTQLSTRVKDFEDLQKRFSVEVVRKEFFDDYIDLFIRLYIEISKDESFIKVLSEQGIDRVKFTKNLLGKIIFVYFVQKKGWLGLDRDGKWGQGDKNFMRSLWNRFSRGDTFVKPTSGFFYNDYLEHLFYNGFNKDRRDDDGYEPNMKMKVPYLNGGLFKEDYRDWEHFIAKISNDIFSNGKDGIMDIFDTYNFTIDEDDLTDAEIAVDPEMLGKIFEKMISVSHGNIDEIVCLYQEKGKVKIGTELNKKFGAFYTPREIVHYMTRESLISYLSTNLSGKKEENEIKIRRLIDAKDQHLSHLETLRLFDNNSDTLASFTHETDTCLQKVKIIDPAVGSGAFPMGILHEITTLRYYLHSEGFCTIHHTETDEGSEELTENGHISLYQIKRETIKNSIYGVDIEPGAIDIARLRFWLSLVVDAEHPEPLPNFEFKFVCANTLMPLENDTEKKQMEFGMLEEANLKTVKKYKREYYNADTKAEKIRISTKLREYTQLPALRLGDIIPKRSLQIDEFGKNFDNSNHSHSFFDPSLMISEWRGFDIVIGNPPYGAKLSESDVKNLKKIFDTTNTETAILFISKGLSFLRKDGVLAYIIPKSYYYASNYADARKITLPYLREIVDCGKAFENVRLETGVILLQKDSSGLKYNSNIFESDTIRPIGKISKTIATKFDFIPNGIYPNEIILGEKILQESILLGSISKNSRGDPIQSKIQPTGELKAIGGAEIDRYGIRGVKGYLSEADILSPKARIQENSILAQNIIAHITKPSDHIKIIACIPQNAEFILADTVNQLVISDADYDFRFIWGLLSSTLTNWYCYLFIFGKAIRTMHFDAVVTNRLPIPKCKKVQQEKIITLVDQILEAKKLDSKTNTSDFEKQIDELVYELYGLTEQEIKIIESK